MPKLDYDRISLLCNTIVDLDRYGPRFKALRDEAWKELHDINASLLTDPEEPEETEATAPPAKKPLTPAKRV